MKPHRGRISNQGAPLPWFGHSVRRLRRKSRTSGKYTRDEWLAAYAYAIKNQRARQERAVVDALDDV